MTRRFSLALAVVLTLLLVVPALAADRYKIDPEHSFVVFKVGHLGASNSLGRFNDPTGAFTIDDANPANSSFEIQIEAQKIDTDNEKRDQHLRSSDFFNVKQYPQITFKSTEVKKAGDGQYEVTGDLNLHGVSKPITVTLTKVGEGKDPGGNVRAGYETTLTINRSDYGISFMPGGVGEQVTLMISLEGIRE